MTTSAPESLPTTKAELKALLVRNNVPLPPGDQDVEFYRKLCLSERVRVTPARAPPTSSSSSPPSSPPTAAPSRKSLALAYLLWLLSPSVGLHHFYLGRDVHFVVHASSFGMFGLSWLRDLWRLPHYVRVSNEDANQRAVLEADLTLTRGVPRHGWVRLLAMLVWGWQCGSVAVSLLPRPEEVPGIPPVAFEAIEVVAVCLGAATGVRLVGCIEPLVSPSPAALQGAALSGILTWVLLGRQPIDVPFYAALGALISSRRAASYRQPPQRRMQVSVTRRAAVASLTVLCGWAVVCGAFVQRGYVIQNDEKVHFKDGLRHFFRSPLYVQFRNTARTLLFEDLPQSGFQFTWGKLAEQMDLTGEAHARRTLGVDGTATFSEIKRAHRALVLEHHPDKQDPLANEEERAAASDRFHEVQAAYETLQQLHKQAASEERAGTAERRPERQSKSRRSARGEHEEL